MGPQTGGRFNVYQYSKMVDRFVQKKKKKKTARKESSKTAVTTVGTVCIN